MPDIRQGEIHSLLVRQLRRHRRSRDVPEQWRGFVDAVNEAYHQSDDDRLMLERSLDLSSQELLEANAEMRALIQELEAKNEEIERFTYAVSHDLKGPVFTIQGFLELLEKDVHAGNTEQFEANIRQIRVASHQIYELLEELLELTRIGQVVSESEELSLGQLAREAATLLSGQIVEAGARVDVAPDLPTVVGDRPLLLRVFQNLIENAVKFAEPGKEPRVEIFARRERSGAVICVRDNGVGIEARHQKKIFGLFDRLEAEREGTGIGLTLVKRVVEVHGGRVWVESEGKGYGSTFCFTLPRDV